MADAMAIGWISLAVLFIIKSDELTNRITVENNINQRDILIDIQQLNICSVVSYKN